MAAWHRSWRVDLGLRAAGLLLCGVALLAMRHLCAVQVHPQPAGVIAFGLAAAAFLGASGGSAMLILGGHLFEEVEVSERWRAKPDTSFAFPAGGQAMNVRKPAAPIVGHEAQGGSTGRGHTATVRGRFALAQRHGPPAPSTPVQAARIHGRLTLRTRTAETTEPADV
jgi:hypothetical protein